MYAYLRVYDLEILRFYSSLQMKTLKFKASKSCDQRSSAVVIDPKHPASLLTTKLISSLEFLDCLNVTAHSYVMHKTCHDPTNCCAMLVVFRSTKHKSNVLKAEGSVFPSLRTLCL